MALVAGLALALAACGGGTEDRAVAACEKAVAEKLAGKTFELDRDDMRRQVRVGDDGVAQISSTVVLDKDLSSESKQTFDCKAKFDPANSSAEPAIIGLQFTW